MDMFAAGPSALHRASPRARPLPDAVGRTAAGGDPGRPGAQANSTGDRVALLRQRLGLPEGTKYDAGRSPRRSRNSRRVHGFKADGIAGAGTIDALNRGFKHYENMLLLNLERAKRLPSTSEGGRYVLVDAGSARLTMYEDGRPVDSMRVIVGSRDTETPMMAALLRFVSVHPWWNTPPELAKKSVAPGVLKEGLKYLTDRDYQVLCRLDRRCPADRPGDGRLAGGRRRQGHRAASAAGRANGIRWATMKFNMPNDFGIYLHDVPAKERDLFTKDNRWISNGCIRLEDAPRFAKWLFGTPGQRRGFEDRSERRPARSGAGLRHLFDRRSRADGPKFRADPYNRDPALLARYFGEGKQQVAAVTP